LNLDFADAAYQISIGLAGAGILASGAFAFRVIRGAIVSRRFPVAGLYRSTFEDIENGKTVYTKAIAELHQRGRKVWGPTYELGTNRRWLLEGDIDPSGRIHGRYTADDPHDVGLGAFFLEMLPDRTLEGMWTGYDSENKTISCGRYLFRRMNKTVTRPMQPADVPAALSILGHALGARYISREELTDFTQNKDKVAYVALTSPKGSIAAAATGVIPVSTDELLDLMPADQSSRVADLVPELGFNLTGLLKSVAVDSDVRGSGVGTEVSRAVVQAMFDMGATNVVSVGWTDGEGCHIQGPLETLGFKSRGDLDDFWYEDSLREGYSCPTCGRPCRCSARIFVLPLSKSPAARNMSRQTKRAARDGASFRLVR
jgi:ribosomal protein S18 acetylase RimI-like enzyme